MSQYQGPQGPQFQPYGPPLAQPPAPRPKRKVPGWLKATGVAFGALILGVIIGTSGGGSTATSSSTSSSTPAPKVTVTKPGPTETATTTVDKVPQACLDALDDAETGFTYAGEAMQAAGNLDTAGIEAATAKLNTVAPAWQADKELCRAAGGR